MYEVGQDVYAQLTAHCKPLAGGKWLFDNHQAIQQQLAVCGVLKSNITRDDACTISDITYHSFRRDKERSGRMLAFIGFQ